jgi:hypothetical protein
MGGPKEGRAGVLDLPERQRRRIETRAKTLAPAFLAIVAEQREIGRVEREIAEAGNDKAKTRKVSSTIAGLSTLAAACAKAKEFEEDPEGARRVAGYLDFDAQPTIETQKAPW